MKRTSIDLKATVGGQLMLYPVEGLAGHGNMNPPHQPRQLIIPKTEK